MSTVVLTEPIVVAKNKPENAPKQTDHDSLVGGRIELQAPPRWIKKLDAAASALGMSRSAYIRMACNRQMKADADAS